jgi:hypothetical protein
VRFSGSYEKQHNLFLSLVVSTVTIVARLLILVDYLNDSQGKLQLGRQSAKITRESTTRERIEIPPAFDRSSQKA